MIGDENFDYTKRKRKNTKRWCRGKPGVEHIVEHVTGRPGRRYGVSEDRCTGCGKVFKTHWSIQWIKWDNSCDTLVKDKAHG